MEFVIRRVASSMYTQSTDIRCHFLGRESTNAIHFVTDTNEVGTLPHVVSIHVYASLVRKNMRIAKIRCH
jgi:hypothetical protein